MIREIYVSVDVETDGPTPGVNSLLSLGAAAFEFGNRNPIATFEVNLNQLPQATPNPDTMVWWGQQKPEIWEYVRKDPQDPAMAMKDFASWVRALPGSPVLVTYPTWDAVWVSWYMGTFVEGRNPFGIGSLDIKSLVYGLGVTRSFKGVTKKNMPKGWFQGTPPHNHTALQDAIGQGVLLVNLLSEMERRYAE